MPPQKRANSDSTSGTQQGLSSPFSSFALTGVTGTVAAAVGLCVVIGACALAAYLGPGRSGSSTDPGGESGSGRTIRRGVADVGQTESRSPLHRRWSAETDAGRSSEARPPSFAFRTRELDEPAPGPGDAAYKEYEAYEAIREQNTRAIEASYTVYQALKKQHDDAVERLRSRVEAVRTENEEAIAEANTEYATARQHHQSQVAEASLRYEERRRRDPNDADRALSEFQQTEQDQQQAIDAAYEEFQDRTAEHRAAIAQAEEELRTAEREHENALEEAWEEYREEQNERQAAIEAAYERYRRARSVVTR